MREVCTVLLMWPEFPFEGEKSACHLRSKSPHSLSSNRRLLSLKHSHQLIKHLSIHPNFFPAPPLSSNLSYKVAHMFVCLHAYRISTVRLRIQAIRLHLHRGTPPSPGAMWRPCTWSPAVWLWWRPKCTTIFCTALPSAKKTIWLKWLSGTGLVVPPSQRMRRSCRGPRACPSPSATFPRWWKANWTFSSGDRLFFKF